MQVAFALRSIISTSDSNPATAKPIVGTPVQYEQGLSLVPAARAPSPTSNIVLASDGLKKKQVFMVGLLSR